MVRKRLYVFGSVVLLLEQHFKNHLSGYRFVEAFDYFFAFPFSTNGRIGSHSKVLSVVSYFLRGKFSANPATCVVHHKYCKTCLENYEYLYGIFSMSRCISVVICRNNLQL